MSISIHWFRQDLRLSDNPAMIGAAQHEYIMPIYILDENNSEEYAMGSASRWWLHHSLSSLKSSLRNNLSIYHGNPIDIIADILARFDISSVHWNRCYEPWRMKRDKKIRDFLTSKNIAVKSYNGSLLWEPWEIKKDDGAPYKVFTPFYRKGCLQALTPRQILNIPKNIQYRHDAKKSLSIDQLSLLPKTNWNKKIEPYWDIGEHGAHRALEKFIDKGLENYKDGRNIPSKPYVSRLSPHIHFGEISPNQLWYSLRSLGDNKNIDAFCSELGWREFSYSLLYYNPDLPRKNLQSKFDLFPWAEDKKSLAAWQMGNTGIPMVDAGMRELWKTGYMHNRVRMIVGSFLVKNLRAHWQHGARWFWDTLIDADLANNSASWQWIAGCGADAAPFFRIFNPVTQGKKFDADGSYIRKYIPEIAALPDKYLFCPWEAPEEFLQKAHIILGKTYPYPIADLKVSRQQALNAFSCVKQKP